MFAIYCVLPSQFNVIQYNKWHWHFLKKIQQNKHLSPQTRVSFSKKTDFEKLTLFDYATYAIFLGMLMRSWVIILFDIKVRDFFCDSNRELGFLETELES